MYLARGADGLETGLRGSINVEVLEFVGGQNVVAAAGTGGLTRVSLEQVLAWNPGVIVTQDPAFARMPLADACGAARGRPRAADLVRAHPAVWLARCAAGRQPPDRRRVARTAPSWLPATTIRRAVRAFYDTFYRVPLSTADLDRLLAEAV